MNSSMQLLIMACFGFVVAHSEPDGEWFSRHDQNSYLKAADRKSPSALYQNGIDKYSTFFPDPIGCKLYIAESSIPNSGLGMYTGVDVEEGEVVGESDISIQIIDIFAHNRDYDGTILGTELIANYVWDSRETGAEFFADNVNTIMPTFGMGTNGHTPLENLNKRMTKDEFVPLDRNADPGSSGVSNYPAMEWYSTKKSPKGSEFFLDYGPAYYDKANMEDIPLQENFDEADEIVSHFHEMITGKELTADSMDELWKDIEFIIQEGKHPGTRKRLKEIFDGSTEFDRDTIKELWKAIKKGTERRTKNALPRLIDVERAFATGTAAHSVPDMIRPMEWLERNGQCMDNLKVGPSTIPHAGQGAFAKRFMGEGSLVVPAPLIQILDRDILNMYEMEMDEEDEELERINDTVIGKQLLLNYCFGHPNSSLLLVPYSHGMLINHDGKNPNAEIRWSESENHRDTLFDSNVKDIPWDVGGLIFDFVATRDIYPGEEVFVDYGREWEEAWKKHLDDWSPVPNQDNMIAVGEMNRDPQSTLKTKDEQEGDPYPVNVHTVCNMNSDRMTEAFEKSRGGPRVDVKWWVSKKDKLVFFPCRVRERRRVQNGGFVYDAEIFSFSHKTAVYGDETVMMVNDIPRTAIRFVEGPYESVQHHENAFRHHVGVPEGIFPKEWLNR